MKELTAERLRELLDYCPDTGVFTRKIRTSNRVKVGDVAGFLRHDGYIGICVHRGWFLAHRLAWLHVHGEWPAKFLDHINGDRSDNRITNLRKATNAENKQNSLRPHVDNKTGYLGVCHDKEKFKAQICINGRIRYIGCFPTPEAAHAAYLEAKRRLHPFGTI